MFCPECGSQVKDGARFCPKCGHTMPQVGPTSTGTPAATSATQVPPAPSPAVSPVMPPRRRSHTVLIAAIICTCVVVGVAGWLVWSTFLSPYPIDQAHFPDGAFRSYVSQTCDTNKDGQLSRDEAKAVTSFGTWSDAQQGYVDTLEGKTITDLTGIEYFPEITSLIASNNAVTSVDLTHNTKLKLVVLECDSLQDLDVTGCSALEQVWVFPDTTVSGLSSSMKKNLLDGSEKQTASSSSWSNASETTRTYDPTGNLLNRKWGYTSSSNEYITTDCSYDGSTLTQAIFESVSSNNSWKYTYTYEHDGNGRISKVTSAGDNADAKTYATLAYDEAGHLTTTMVYTNEGKLSETTTYSYDEAGRLVKVLYSYDGSSYSSGFALEYDSSGKVSKTQYISQTGDSVNVAESDTYTYDDAGSIATVTEYSSKGVKQADTSREYSRDSAGTVTSETDVRKYYKSSGTVSSTTTTKTSFAPQVLYSAQTVVTECPKNFDTLPTANQPSVMDDYDLVIEN